VLKPKSLPLFSNLFNFNIKIKFIFNSFLKKSLWRLIILVFRVFSASCSDVGLRKEEGDTEEGRKQDKHGSDLGFRV
jgi:hypothetical protein